MIMWRGRDWWGGLPGGETLDKLASRHTRPDGSLRGREELLVASAGQARPSPILDPRQADGGVRGSGWPVPVHVTAYRWRRERRRRPVPKDGSVRSPAYFFRCRLFIQGF